ncbi:MAG: hypothetical protein WD773_04180 [Gemmatimonadales bacterium]
MTDALRAELRTGKGATDLRDAAIETGMRAQREDGLRLVRAGVTTPEEVLRVVRA